jgi:serine/threonine protein kinase
MKDDETIAVKMENLCVDYDHFNPDDPSMIAIAEELAMVSAKVDIEDFMVLKVLGRGSYGKVMLIQHKEEGNLFALKTLRKKKVIKTSQVGHTKAERQYLLLLLLGY